MSHNSIGNSPAVKSKLCLAGYPVCPAGHGSEEKEHDSFQEKPESVDSKSWKRKWNGLSLTVPLTVFPKPGNESFPPVVNKAWGMPVMHPSAGNCNWPCPPNGSVNTYHSSFIWKVSRGALLQRCQRAVMGKRNPFMKIHLPSGKQINRVLERSCIGSTHAHERAHTKIYCISSHTHTFIEFHYPDCYTNHLSKENKCFLMLKENLFGSLRTGTSFMFFPIVWQLFGGILALLTSFSLLL